MSRASEPGRANMAHSYNHLPHPWGLGVTYQVDLSGYIGCWGGGGVGLSAQKEAERRDEDGGLRNKKLCFSWNYILSMYFSFYWIFFHTLQDTFCTWLDLAAGFVLVYQNLYHLSTRGQYSDRAALGVSMGAWKEVDDGREEERARLGDHEVHFVVLMAVKSWCRIMV